MQIEFLKKVCELSIPVIHLQLVKSDTEENWHDKQFKYDYHNWYANTDLCTDNCGRWVFQRLQSPGAIGCCSFYKSTGFQ